MGGWKDAIDRDWVFAACLARADHPRRLHGHRLDAAGLGWVDPDSVVAFIDGPGARLSSLSRREALLNIHQ